MFTIAGRPAAKVSKSLFGEFVASTGTSLKSVRQAFDSAASRATSVLLPLRKCTFGGAASSSSARRLPSPMSTKVTSGTSRAASTTAVRSLASPMAPKYETWNGPSGPAGSNRSRSAEFGTRTRLPRRQRRLDSRRERDQPRAAAVDEALHGARHPLRERVAKRAHLDRRLRPQVAHLEHERGAPAQRRHQRGQRHRERRRGRVDHVRPRPAHRGERGAEREAREREHPAQVRHRGRAHVVRVGAAHPDDLDPVDRPGVPRPRLPCAPRVRAPRNGARTRTSACRPRPRG